MPVYLVVIRQEDMFCLVYTTSCVFFFFRQKTAYERRIGDWSSDVCSSDLVLEVRRPGGQRHRLQPGRQAALGRLRLRQHRLELGKAAEPDLHSVSPALASWRFSSARSSQKQPLGWLIMAKSTVL